MRRSEETKKIKMKRVWGKAISRTRPARDLRFFLADSPPPGDAQETFTASGGQQGCDPFSRCHLGGSEQRQQEYNIGNRKDDHI